jgi:hypothetical protein
MASLYQPSLHKRKQQAVDAYTDGALEILDIPPEQPPKPVGGTCSKRGN